MQTFSSTDTERNLAVELILEDIPGGGVVEKDDFPTSATGMKEGALLGVDSDGIYHLTKTAMLANALVASGFNHVVVYNNHEFKAGDLLGYSLGTASGVRITSVVASGTGKDVLNLSSNLSIAIAASGLVIENATSGFNGGGFRYSPVAIATNPVDLTNDNNGCGLLVRGRVRTSQLPYFVDATIKALLPLVRFV
ncbi:MAG TPA: hypothetical protein VI911_06010 [Patescibacteria group bacterium]|nr:hypothetical protein [Patescibacteria group bacterium]